MNKLVLLERELKTNAFMASEHNVPIGFVMNTDGDFLLKYSLSNSVKKFTLLEDLIEEVIKGVYPKPLYSTCISCDTLMLSCSQPLCTECLLSTDPQDDTEAWEVFAPDH